MKGFTSAWIGGLVLFLGGVLAGCSGMAPAREPVDDSEMISTMDNESDFGPQEHYGFGGEDYYLDDDD